MAAAALLAFFVLAAISLLLERADLLGQFREEKVRTAALEEKEQVRPAAESAAPGPLSIENLRISRGKNGRGLAVSFRLVSSRPGESPYSGTLAMVVRNDSLRLPGYRVIPEMRLQKGIPQEPAKGRSFQLQEPKFVDGFFEEHPGEVMKTLTVFIFSPEGKIILQKSADIPALPGGQETS